MYINIYLSSLYNFVPVSFYTIHPNKTNYEYMLTYKMIHVLKICPEAVVCASETAQYPN